MGRRVRARVRWFFGGGGVTFRRPSRVAGGLPNLTNAVSSGADPPSYPHPMPLVHDTAICIRSWDYSETSQTVSLFARDAGVMRGIAKGSKRPRSKFSGGIDLLTRGHVVAIVKSGRDLATLTEWDLLEIYWPLRQQLEANRFGLYAADLVHHMVTDHDPHPDLFDAFELTLATLGRGGDNERILLRFQWALLRETGYRPELDLDAVTGDALPVAAETLAFSARAGGLVPDTGTRDRWRVRKETVDLLRSLAASEETGPTGEGAHDRDAARRANRLLASYIREILGYEPSAMRWALPDL